jgi:hypothetical protein
MPREPTPFQQRMTKIGLDAMGIKEPDMSGPTHLTLMERALYNDDYTSSTTVYDETCYICRDPDFARMGLPLCRACDECKKAGRGLGHVAADDVKCTVCGWDSYAVYMEEQENEANSGNA